MARCKILCHQDEGAVRVYEEVLADHPNSLEASVGMAETLHTVSVPVCVWVCLSLCSHALACIGQSFTWAAIRNSHRQTRFSWSHGRWR